MDRQRKEKILQREIELDNLRDLKASKSMTNKLNFSVRPTPARANLAEVAHGLRP